MANTAQLAIKVQYFTIGRQLYLKDVLEARSHAANGATKSDVLLEECKC